MPRAGTQKTPPRRRLSCAVLSSGLLAKASDLDAVILATAEAALAPAPLGQIGTTHTSTPLFGHLQILSYPANQTYRVACRERRHTQMVEDKVIAPDVCFVLQIETTDPTPPAPRLPCENGGFGLSIVRAHADIAIISTRTRKTVSAHLKSDT